MTITFLLFTLAQASDRGNIEACLVLAQNYFSVYEADVEELLLKLDFDVNASLDRIISDVLVNCFENIHEGQGDFVLNEGFEYTSDWEYLVGFDPAEYMKMETIERNKDQEEVLKYMRSTLDAPPGDNRVFIGIFLLLTVSGALFGLLQSRKTSKSMNVL